MLCVKIMKTVRNAFNSSPMTHWICCMINVCCLFYVDLMHSSATANIGCSNWGYFLAYKDSCTAICIISNSSLLLAPFQTICPTSPNIPWHQLTLPHIGDTLVSCLSLMLALINLSLCSCLFVSHFFFLSPHRNFFSSRTLTHWWLW